MSHWFYVFLGGGLGSVMRYFIGLWLNAHPYFMPYGTFAVNILGSFLIGLAGGISLKYTAHHPVLLYFFMTGFLGGFTTFSSFSFETFNLIRNGDLTMGIIYTTTSVILGLFTAALGFFLAKNLF